MSENQEKQPKKKKERKPSFFRGLLFVFGYFILYFIMNGIFYSFLSEVAIDGVPLPNYTTIASMLASIVLFGIPPLLYCKIKGVKISDSLKFKNPGLKNGLYSLLVGVLMAPILYVLVGLIGFVFMGGNAQAAADEIIESGFILTFIGVAIVPAICEELTFRGLFFYKLRKLKPLQIAILTSLAFSLVHMNLVQCLYTLFMGFCFFYLVHYTGSIWAAVLAHFAVNAYNTIEIQIMMLLAKPEVAGVEAAAPSMLSEMFSLALAIGCAILLIIVFRKIKKNNLALLDSQAMA